MIKPKHIIFFLFFLSGISGLLYETIWLRILSRILGNTIYATSIVLAAFMLGLTLGSYYIGKYADKSKNQIRLYAYLEAAAGIAALLIFFLFDKLLPLYRILFEWTNENKTGFLIMQTPVLFILLIIPTFLMGGTLPVLSAYTKKYNISLSSLMGNLYGLNTLGAVVGVTASGFFTIEFFGEFNTMITGVFINFLVSIIAFLLFKQPHPSGSFQAEKIIASSEQAGSPYPLNVRNILLVTYGMVGFTSFAMEVVWSRMFQFQLGTSIYAFSIMLATYLAGSATGSMIGGRYAARIKNPVEFTGRALLFIAFYSVAGLHLFTIFHYQQSLPLVDGYKIGVPVILVFPVTFVLGIIFPLLSKSYIDSNERIAMRVGQLYSINTLGCILGAMICGFFLIKFFGTRATIIILAAILSVFSLLVYYSQSRAARNKKTALFMWSGLSVIFFIGLLSPDPFYTVIKKWIGKNKNDEIYYHRESEVATTTAFGSATDSLDKHLYINGTGMTALVIETKLMAHLPLLLNDHEQKDMLIICFGMGTTLKSAMSYPSTEVDIVELVPEVYQTYKYFHKEGKEILKNKRVHPHIDDGRNYLLLHDKQYDVITIDPAPPLWAAGTVNLYAREFFELCKSHIRKNGVVCLWVPPDSYRNVRMIMKTFYKVFNNTHVYGSPHYPGIFLIGTLSPLQIRYERFQRAFEDKTIMADMNEWGAYFPSPDSLQKLLIFTPAELKEYVKDEEEITDNYPYTEFLLWRMKYDEEGNRELNSHELRKWKGTLSLNQ